MGLSTLLTKEAKVYSCPPLPTSLRSNTHHKCGQALASKQAAKSALGSSVMFSTGNNQACSLFYFKLSSEPGSILWSYVPFRQLSACLRSQPLSLEPVAPDTQVHIPALWRLHAVFFILHLRTFVLMSNTSYIWKIVLPSHTL